MKNYPTFLIVGAMKCATSTLHSQLALQPGIFMTDLKEPNFFSDDDQYIKGLDWYAAHFKNASPNDLRGESSTHYAKLPTYPQTVSRMQAALDDIKLIYVMRHPVDRLVSQYFHEWTQRVITADINQAIEEHAELISYSQYASQLQPYLETFGPERILPVFFERLVLAPQEELERICRFIHYPSVPTWDFKLEAENRSAERLRQCRWRDALVETPVLSTIRRHLVPQRLRTWVKGFWRMKEKPRIAPLQMKRLTTVFDEDLSQLGAWLGLDLTCDSFKSVVREQVPDWKSTASLSQSISDSEGLEFLK